eukprot:TRINITY_DN10407_c0_g1_i3.p1 TRINITY_DN10407_c0_g1~~TRINITY_DN10407_c0_g1_i3.p1  ORF type:complete len:114 (-),score=16.11 TRINITY_DN10407_c0_g1_i3:388-729(-)
MIPPEPSEKDEARRHSYAGERVRFNHQQLSATRVRMAMAAGALTGLLGASGWGGLMLLVLWTLLSTLLLRLRFAHALADYFVSPSSLYSEGLSNSCLTFVLFWTFAYNIVYVF